jgi:hypothetical protein
VQQGLNQVIPQKSGPTGNQYLFARQAGELLGKMVVDIFQIRMDDIIGLIGERFLIFLSGDNCIWFIFLHHHFDAFICVHKIHPVYHTFHGCIAALPQLFQNIFVAQGIHGMPKSLVPKGGQHVGLGQFFHGFLLPHREVVGNIIKTPGSSTKKPPFIHAPSPWGFSLKEGILFCPLSRLKAPKRPGG